MKPEYISNFVEDPDKLIWNSLFNLVWLEATPARKEYFMAKQQIPYMYGSGKNERVYHASPYIQSVLDIENKLNKEFDANFNVCFLNRYDQKQHALNWHADDSVEMNLDHPIAVISFGAERDIWWKSKDLKGTIPPENKQKLESESLFLMPTGFQRDHFHKIPKCDRECGTRISLTFRNYLFYSKTDEPLSVNRSLFNTKNFLDR